jgi:hypothetical protein
VKVIISSAAFVMGSFLAFSAAMAEDASTSITLSAQGAATCTGLSLASSQNLTPAIQSDNTVAAHTFTLTPSEVTCTVAGAKISLMSDHGALSNNSATPAAFGFTNEIEYTATATWVAGAETIQSVLNTALIAPDVPVISSTDTSDAASGPFTLSIATHANGDKVTGTTYSDTLTVKVGPGV